MGRPLVPRVAHVVFGLEPQHEPFHFFHYVSLESCRRMLAPEAIYFHHKHTPWGPWWDRIRPHLTPVEVDLVPEVLAADYSGGDVPPEYRYAHHADFIRLDVLLEHGGVYADIDTIFVRPFPADLYESPFVIGREPPVQGRPSLCNALLLAEPGAAFARAWRERMAGELDGTWSNHSGFLAQTLSEQMPEAVRVEPEGTFFPFAGDRLGLARLLAERHAVPADALSVHLWAHLWWEQSRRDFTDVHAGSSGPAALTRAQTTLADLARPYLPEAPKKPAWSYIGLDGYYGYAVAAHRCVAALAGSGLDVQWRPTVDGVLPPPADAPVVVAHLVPEFYERVREQHPDSFLVGHTVWETDRVPDHWYACFEQVDLLVVPSSFNAKVFAASGVGTPVAVVPHVAPPIVTRPSLAWADIPRERLVFYTIAEWTERKAVFRTVEAYLRAFSGDDPVLLVVKTSPLDRSELSPAGTGTAGRGTTAWSLAMLLAGHPNPPAVKLYTAPCSNDDIGALHRRGDCFVSLARSEGWGLGAFDAAAYGNPVVTTGYGGQLDYLGDSPWLVDFDLVPVHDPAGYPSYAPDQRWAEPRLEHAVTLLREIAERPGDAKALARAAARPLRERYRPARIASLLRAAVDERFP
jgi:glycosyltransferase involved in cell wall biosynthesis